MGVCTSSGKGGQSLSRETTSSLMSSWNRLNQRGIIISADDFHKRNSIGKELLKRAVDGSSNSAYYEEISDWGIYSVNLGPNNPSYRIGQNEVSIIPTSGESNVRVKMFENPAEAVKFIDSEIKRIKGNRK